MYVKNVGEKPSTKKGRAMNLGPCSEHIYHVEMENIEY